jgi:aconitate hydratase 2/2-methylisocitrate dehydratase
MTFPTCPTSAAGGVVIGGKIAPIFFNTAEDSGALPIECDVSALNSGDVITIRPYAGTIERDGEVKWPISSSSRARSPMRCVPAVASP